MSDRDDIAREEIRALQKRISKLEEKSAIHYVCIGDPSNAPPSIGFEEAIKLILDHLGLELLPQTKLPPRLLEKKKGEGS